MTICVQDYKDEVDRVTQVPTMTTDTSSMALALRLVDGRPAFVLRPMNSAQLHATATSQTQEEEEALTRHDDLNAIAVPSASATTGTQDEINLDVNSFDEHSAPGSSGAITSSTSVVPNGDEIVVLARLAGRGGGDSSSNNNNTDFVQVRLPRDACAQCRAINIL